MPPYKQHAPLKLDKARGTLAMLQTLAENMVGGRTMYKSLACHCVVEYIAKDPQRLAEFLKWWREQPHLQSDKGENAGVMQYNRKRAKSEA